MSEESVNLLCLNCGEATRYTLEDLETESVCPKCGDDGYPAVLDDTVTVTLTVHELRILTFWAERFANVVRDNGRDPNNRMGHVLNTITDRLNMQTNLALSFAQELEHLRGHGMAIVYFNPDTRECLECGSVIDTEMEDVLSHRCSDKETHEIALSDLPPLETTDERAAKEENPDEA